VQEDWRQDEARHAHRAALAMSNASRFRRHQLPAPPPSRVRRSSPASSYGSKAKNGPLCRSGPMGEVAKLRVIDPLSRGPSKVFIHVGMAGRSERR